MPLTWARGRCWRCCMARERRSHRSALISAHYNVHYSVCGCDEEGEVTEPLRLVCLESFAPTLAYESNGTRYIYIQTFIRHFWLINILKNNTVRITFKNNNYGVIAKRSILQRWTQFQHLMCG